LEETLIDCADKYSSMVKKHFTLNETARNPILNLHLLLPNNLCHILCDISRNTRARDI
jgi:hypothetical protein